MKTALSFSQAVLPVVLLLAAGCSARDGEVVSEGEYLVFQPIALGQVGALTDTTEAVYRTADAWAAATDSLRVNEPIRPVDFEQTMVVLIALPQDHGGYGIEVESVERTPDGIIVDYAVAQPGSDCIPVVGMSLPFQVVTVARSEESVRFVRRVEPYRCTWRQDG